MWKMVNYEVCGISHYKTNTPCQDKTKCKKINDVYCIALADGAGSAKLSHFGAEIVVDSITNYLTENFDVLISNEDGVFVKKQIINHIIDNLKEKTIKYECELKDLASTLLFVAIKDEKFIIGHIGDGIIGYLKDDEILIASKPNNGEFANTTYFVTSSNSYEKMRIIKGNINQIKGFVLMSDGTSDSFYIKKEEKLSETTKKVLEWTSILEKEKIFDLIKDSFDNLVVKNTTDDCSIAVIAKSSNESRLDLLKEDEKLNLFEITHLKKNKQLKRLNRYETIINLYYDNKSLKSISKAIHLKPKYTKRYIKKLIELRFLSKK